MRSESLQILILNPNDHSEFKKFLNENGIDYEYSSALEIWVIYFHFDDIFPYHPGLTNFFAYVTGIINTFPYKKGKYNDYVELYYEVDKKELNEDIDWFEINNRYFQNVRFEDFLKHMDKELNLRQNIIKSCVDY